MKLKLLLIILLCLTACATPAKWTKGDINREIAFQVLNVADIALTQKVLQDPNVREMNPFLGDKPSAGRLAAFGAGVGISHALVTHYIKPEWRPFWQWAGIVVKVGCIANNYSIYVGSDF
jgi:hypothetical protein